MSRGKRYNGEAKLNMKKVLAVLVALLVIVMFVFVIYRSTVLLHTLTAFFYSSVSICSCENTS